MCEGARRDGFEGAEEMASSENSLPMAGAAKLRAVFLFARGGRLLSPPHKLCGSRKIDGLVFLLPAPSCSFVILGFVRVSPSSPRHRICRVMHG